MREYFCNMHPVWQAFAAGCGTWLFTALGAATVFFFRDFNKRLLNAALGFAAGVMLAATFWSLLLPAIRLSADKTVFAWLPAAIGFFAGGFLMRVIDTILPHLHIYLPVTKAEGIKTSWQKSTLLVWAMSLHNIPEGLVIGVSFGAISQGAAFVGLPAAIALAVGIGIQDIPEGMAVSIPLYRKGVSRIKSFWYGQLSGAVEPIAALIGALAVSCCKFLLPYAMGFAAGAMIFVIVEELIPESQHGDETDMATIGTMIGLVFMMALEVMFW